MRLNSGLVGICCILLLQSVSVFADQVGALTGQFSASPGGAATYTIPLTLPPGVAGAVPSLGFSYSSQGSNGVMGVGWGISGESSVTRCPQTRQPDGASSPLALSSSDRFCLDGQRLILVSATGNYGDANSVYRTEIDNFSRVTAIGGKCTGSPVYGVTCIVGFRVETKSGQTMEYGNISGSNSDAVLNANTSLKDSIPLAWKLARVYDRNPSHLITYSYALTLSTGEQYLSRVSYGYNQAQSANLVDVVFSYTSLQLPVTTYVAGSKVRLGSLLSGVTVNQAATATAPGTGKSAVRSYNISYEVAPGTLRQRITQIQSCFADSTCVPATTFGWTNFTGTTLSSSSVWLSGLTFSSGSAPLVQDMNGDGLPDIVSFSGAGVNVATNNGTSAFTQSATPWLADFSTTTAMGATGQVWNNSNSNPIFLADMDGDGAADIVGFGNSSLWWAKNKGSSFAAASQILTGIGPFNSAIQPNVLVDMNGDGATDYLKMGTNYPSVSTNSKTYTPASFFCSTSCPFPSPSGNFMGTSAGWTDNVTFPRMPVDLNGDGGPEIIGFGPNALVTGTTTPSTKNGVQNGVQVAINVNGAAFAPTVATELSDFSIDSASSNTTTTYQNWTDNNTMPRTLVDVNGDGYPDIVGFGKDGVWVSLNTGTGFMAASNWLYDFGSQTWGVGGTGCTGLNGNTVCTYSPTNSWPVPKTYQNWPDNTSTPRFFADINGDGLPDIVGIGCDGVWVSFGTGTGFSTAVKWSSEFGNTAILMSKATYDSQGDTYQNNCSQSGVATNNWGNNSVNPRTILDVNGDGTPDMLAFGPDGVRVALSPQTIAPDLITTISNSLGTSYTIAYSSLTQNGIYTKATGDINPVLDVIAPVTVVSSVKMTSGVGAVLNTTKYQYGAFKAHIYRGSLGFGWVEALDTSTKVKSHTEYFQGFPYTGMLSKQQNSFCNFPTPDFTQVCSLLSQIVNTTGLSYSFGSATTPANQTVQFPYIQSTTTTSYEPPTVQ